MFNLSVFLTERRGKQLWKYLYQLLQDETHKKVICWSDNAKNQFEFKLLEPEEVATLWGKEKGKLNMNYDKLVSLSEILLPEKSNSES